MSSGKGKARVVASIAIFAVLYAVLRLIPTFPIIGISDAFFPLSDIIVPITFTLSRLLTTNTRRFNSWLNSA